MTDWRQRGSCAKGDPDRFFVTSGPASQALHEICAACPSLIPCTFDALRHTELGFQAGLSGADRDRIRRWDRRMREKAATP